MKLIQEIVHQEGIRQDGKALCRTAVRGIILRENKLLMIHSAQNGDLKFPGGGIDDGETHHQALVREIREECGATVSHIDGAFGCVIEYAAPLEHEYDVFKMTSFYYLCRIAPMFGAQHLDQYEQDLGFAPRWVDVDTAIQINQSILHSGQLVVPRWTRREIVVLEKIREQLGPSA